MSEVRNEWDSSSWTHEIMERGHDFGMQADNGRAFFGKVMQREYVMNLKADRYAELAANTALGNWAGGGAKAWNILIDAANNELLWEEEKEYILQVFYAPDPPEMRTWIQFPTGQRVGDLSKIYVDTPADINTPGYIDGFFSPEYDPHRYTEMLIPHGLHVAFQVYNPKLFEAMMPFLIFNIVRYKVRWYHPEDQTDMKVIKQFADFIYNNQKGRPVKYWQPSVKNFTYGSKTNVNVDSVDILDIARKAEVSRTGGRQ